MTVIDDILFSRVNGVDIKMSCDGLASFLDIENLRFDLYNESLPSFNQFPEVHSPEYTSRLIHNNPDSFLFLNDDVTIFTFLSQVVAKILLHNVVPEFDTSNRAMKCISLLSYCFLSFYSINLLKLIFDIITVSHILSDNLPFCMLHSQFFKFWHTGLSEDVFIPPLEPLLSLPHNMAVPDSEPNLSWLPLGTSDCY